MADDQPGEETPDPEAHSDAEAGAKADAEAGPQRDDAAVARMKQRVKRLWWRCASETPAAAGQGVALAGLVGIVTSIGVAAAFAAITALQARSDLKFEIAQIEAAKQ